MKSKILTFLALSLFFAGVFSSCKKTEPEKPQLSYPIKISFEEYSLEGTKCKWKNLPNSNTAILLNSNDELEQYIACHESTYPVIDFSKHSLLLASGKFYSGILEPVVTDFLQHSQNKYSLDMEITLSDTAVPKSWVKALVVKKMTEESKVKLKETYVEQDLTYPVDVHFLDYSLEGTGLKWPTMYGGSKGKYLIINNKTVFESLNYQFDVIPYPEIDFKKYSFILVYGNTDSPLVGTFEIDKRLQRIDKKNYVMNIYITTINRGRWYVPILVNKISDYVPIELIVEYK